MLGSQQFANELTHLLARDFSRVGDQIDAGSMCRDSAILAATLSARLGHKATICEGKMGVVGPVAGQASISLRFESHAWINVEGYGICDYSIDFRPGSGPGWHEVPIRYLAGSQYRPASTQRRGKYTRDPATFDQVFGQMTERPPGFGSVYLEQRRLPFTDILFIGGMNYAQSVLTRELSKQKYFALNLYAKAAVHLWRLMRNKSRTLTTLTQPAAWREIARISDGAADSFRARLHFSADAWPVIEAAHPA